MSLLSTAEILVLGLIQAGNTACQNFYTGEDNADKETPSIAVRAYGPAEEDPAFSGNFWIHVELEVKTPAPIDVDGADPKAAHDTLAGQAYDLVFIDDLPAQLNALAAAAQAPFTAQGFIPEGPDANFDGDHWISLYKLRLYCCNSTLAA